MPIVKCHHHGFTVSDAERSVAFYRDLLGLELVRVSERRDLPSYDRILGHDNVVLKVAILRHPVGEFILELVEYQNPVGRKRELDNPFIGSSHLAFEVDDVDVVYALLRDEGYGAINRRWMSNAMGSRLLARCTGWIPTESASRFFRSSKMSSKNRLAINASGSADCVLPSFCARSSV